MHRLKRAVLELADALEHAREPAARRALEHAIDTLVADLELADERVVPAWVTDMLAALAARTTTAGWQRFRVVGLEASDTMEFLRHLHELVPITSDLRGETWTFAALPLCHEAIVTFEGESWRASPVGTPLD